MAFGLAQTLVCCLLSFLLVISTGYYFVHNSCCNSKVNFPPGVFSCVSGFVFAVLCLCIFPLTPRPPLKLGIAWPTICQLPRAKTSQNVAPRFAIAPFSSTLQPSNLSPSIPSTVNCAVLNPVTASVLDRQMCSRNS